MKLSARLGHGVTSSCAHRGRVVFCQSGGYAIFIFQQDSGRIPDAVDYEQFANAAWVILFERLKDAERPEIRNPATYMTGTIWLLIKHEIKHRYEDIVAEKLPEDESTIPQDENARAQERPITGALAEFLSTLPPTLRRLAELEWKRSCPAEILEQMNTGSTNLRKQRERLRKRAQAFLGRGVERPGREK